MYKALQMVGAALFGFFLVDIWIRVLGWVAAYTDVYGWRLLGFRFVEMSGWEIWALLLVTDVCVAITVGSIAGGLLTASSEIRWWLILATLWIAFCARLLVEILVGPPGAIMGLWFLLTQIDFWVLVSTSVLAGWVVSRQSRAVRAQQGAAADAAKPRG